MLKNIWHEVKFAAKVAGILAITNGSYFLSVGGQKLFGISPEAAAFYNYGNVGRIWVRCIACCNTSS